MYRYIIVFILLVSVLYTDAVQISGDAPYPMECTAGVADGSVTIDGRPLLWKLRNEIDTTNDVHYFAPGEQYYSGLGPATLSYLGMGPANDGTEGPVRQGMNSEGIAVGWNTLEDSGWEELHHQALGQYSLMGEVRSYIDDMTNLSTFNYFIDSAGEAALWENLMGDQHWEYNTGDLVRSSQWIDVDNADLDDDYSTGVDVNLSGWVVRANTPAHFNSDGSDDLENTGRYMVGRDIIGSLVYNNGNGTSLSAKFLARKFFRDDVLAKYDTVSSMIVHGVLPNEDPRLSTMWTLLGHSEYGIFVPVWIHGVESGGANKVPQYLDSGDDGVCVYDLTEDMLYEGFNEVEVQARTLPFEEHLFDQVNEKLLPGWRDRDWTDPDAVAIVGEEMKRVQEQMDEDAYLFLRDLYDYGSTSNYAPTVSIDSFTQNQREATFYPIADDEDGGGLTYLYNYGDGQTGSQATHLYNQYGDYLVSCTVTDADGASQTAWLFVKLEDYSCSDGDSDSVCDDEDNCPWVANSDQTDTDSDGVGDACDDCVDVDYDTVCDDEDNCPGVANYSQTDTDSDGIGDACEYPDLDQDTVSDDEDNCPWVANSSQTDTDSDGVGDACDDCPLDPNNDADGDGVCGDVDVCLGGGDDTIDTDDDGIPNGCDFCPNDPNDTCTDDVRLLISGVSQSASVSLDDWVYYMIEAGSNHTDLEVVLSGLSSDVDLYVKNGDLPTLTVYDCASYLGGTNPETCTLENSGENTWYIGVQGYTAGSFTIIATLTELGVFDEIIDNDADGFSTSGTWYSSSLVSGYYGSNYRYAVGGSGGAVAEWAFELPSDGYYQVLGWWSAPYSTRASDAPYTIYHADGTTTVEMDQTTDGSQWNDMGTYHFTSGEALVVLTNDTSGNPVADAVRIIGSCIDSDQDTVCDNVDNCSGVANSDQTDTDSDGIGDACEYR